MKRNPAQKTKQNHPSSYFLESGHEHPSHSTVRNSTSAPHPHIAPCIAGQIPAVIDLGQATPPPSQRVLMIDWNMTTELCTKTLKRNESDSAQKSKQYETNVVCRARHAD